MRLHTLLPTRSDLARRTLIAVGLLLVGLSLPDRAAPALAQSDLNVVVNTIDAQPAAGQPGYDVTAYVSVTDAHGAPITDLTAAAFSASQDGSPVTLASASITRRPASIMLALDTSGSMTVQGKMDAVKAASSTFVSNLDAPDQVGVIYFNDQVTLAQNLSSDHQAALSIIGLVAARPGAGTCLYDAAYQAVTAATTAPSGQRAVILLTDGVDERPDQSGPCSTHSLDQVVAYATSAATRAPIYTLGVGSRIDDNVLNQIAEGTGGTFLKAADTDNIAGLFSTVSAQLKNQYALTYRLETTSGEHSLTVTVSRAGGSAVGTRSFLAPELPPALALSGLESGSLLDGSRAVRAAISGKGEVAKVSFTLDGKPLSEDNDPPYEAALDSAALAQGSHKLAAAATLKDGTVLKADLDFAVAPPTAASAAPPARGPVASLSLPPEIAIPAGIGILLVLGAVAVVLLRARRGQTVVSAPHRFTPGAYGSLTVHQSVSLKKGEVFDLSGEVVTIGRGEDNTLTVPDAPVSRRHAEIRYSGGVAQVVDLGSTYGTFINGERLTAEPHPLKDGDKLRVGSRTTLTFAAAVQPEAGMADRTMDSSAMTIMGMEGAEGTLAVDNVAPIALETERGRIVDARPDPARIPTTSATPSPIEATQPSQDQAPTRPPASDDADSTEPPARSRPARSSEDDVPTLPPQDDVATQLSQDAIPTQFPESSPDQDEGDDGRTTQLKGGG